VQLNVSKTYTLIQNYPNPFNSETTIRYSIPLKTEVRLIIYNLNGQKVRTLVNEEKASGSYTVTWDGKDDKGQNVVSGIYIYDMNAGDFTEKKKMVLLK
jgi:flagellar hook assembly protein FlgD